MLYNIINPTHFQTSLEAVKHSYWPYEGQALDDSLPTPFHAEWFKLFEPRSRPMKEDDDPDAYQQSIKLSQNGGNFNHMVNVTAAMAHLIRYFSAAWQHGLTYRPYDPGGDKRTLRLMMATYYHDIGKVIVNRRHAVEGMGLFAERKASTQNQLERIFERHGFTWTSSDCGYLSALIGSHDTFGTLTTGENGLFSLLDAARAFALLENDDIGAAKNDMFDLWLLNIADIMVSIKDKWVPHKEFTETPPGESDEDIQGFFKTPQGIDLLSDVSEALEIAETAYRPADLEAYVLDKSEAAAGKRFIRLLRQTLLFSALHAKPGLQAHAGLCGALETLVYDDRQLRVMVETALPEKLGASWARKFGTMGQFDYALGFFRKVSQRAVYWIDRELVQTPGVRTGWLHSPKPGGVPREYSPSFIDRYNAEAIVNNYIVFMADIFGDIAKLLEGMGLWHIEFEDAMGRLTDAKADKLLYIDGPHRAGHMRGLLMKELMLYKS
jgi:hypothetical protein